MRIYTVPAKSVIPFLLLTLAAFAAFSQSNQNGSGQQTATETSSFNLAMDQILIGVLSSVIFAILVFLFAGFVRAAYTKLTTVFWRSAAWLGTQRGFERFGLRAYKRAVAARYGQVINVYVGLGDRTETLDLEQVFVPLSLFNQSQSDIDLNRRTARSILTDPDNSRLVILGDPGSGKTTLVKAIASGVSRAQWPEFRDLVPIYVRLREFTSNHIETDMMTFIENHVVNNADTGGLLENLQGSSKRRQTFQMSSQLLHRLTETERVLFILDGIDEINEGQIDDFWSKLEAFLGSAGQNRVIVTCRSQNYASLTHMARELRFAKFNEYQLGDLSDGEVERMINYRKDDFVEYGKSIADFTASIRMNEQISSLHRNPLLLTVSIGMYLQRANNKIPQNRAEFYKESLSHLLTRHDFLSQKGIARKNVFDGTDKLELLKTFALQIVLKATEDGTDFSDFDFSDIVDATSVLANERIQISQHEASEFVSEIHKNAGLIDDVGPERNTGRGRMFAFSHRSFHEFCAALALSEKTSGLETILNNAENQNWWQIAIFYAGLPIENAKKLVDELLAKSDLKPTQLALVGRTAAALALPFEELRTQVIERLEEALSADSADDASRTALLQSLIALCRESPENPAQRAKEVLQHQFSARDPELLATQVARLEPHSALQLLELFSEADDPRQQAAAVSGLARIDGPAKIPVLWRLYQSTFGKDQEGAMILRHGVAGQIENEIFNSLESADVLNSLQRTIVLSDLDKVELVDAFPFVDPSDAPNHAYLHLGYKGDGGIRSAIGLDQYDPMYGIRDDKDIGVILSKCNNTGAAFKHMCTSKKNKKMLSIWKKMSNPRMFEIKIRTHSVILYIILIYIAAFSYTLPYSLSSMSENVNQQWTIADFYSSLSYPIKDIFTSSFGMPITSSDFSRFYTPNAAEDGFQLLYQLAFESIFSIYPIALLFSLMSYMLVFIVMLKINRIGAHDSKLTFFSNYLLTLFFYLHSTFTFIDFTPYRSSMRNKPQTFTFLFFRLTRFYIDFSLSLIIISFTMASLSIISSAIFVHLDESFPFELILGILLSSHVIIVFLSGLPLFIANKTIVKFSANAFASLLRLPDADYWAGKTKSPR